MGPELPIPVKHGTQVDGEMRDGDSAIYQTHRGKQPRSRVSPDLPPNPKRPLVALRPEEDLP